MQAEPRITAARVADLERANESLLIELHAATARPRGIELYVKLTGSKNTALAYPCYGLLDIQEVNARGIVQASFRVVVNGILSEPVSVGYPKFEYRPRIAENGRSAVLELRERTQPKF